MTYEILLAAAEAAVPEWPYGIAMEHEEGRWLRTDPLNGLERFAIAWYRESPPPVDVYTRAQYEAACAAAGIEPAADSELGNYADKHAEPRHGEWPAEAHVALTLRRRRIFGLQREAPPAPPPQLPPIEVSEPRTTCHFCGLPLGRKGSCEECV